MARRCKYLRYIVSEKYGFHRDIILISDIIEDGKVDNSENWEMTQFSQDYAWWNCGYINFHLSPLVNRANLEKYWWCRWGKWMPFWGKKTEQRAEVMKEIRAYWRRQWFSKEVPKIKKIISEMTKLVPDVIHVISSYLYPYQIKPPPANPDAKGGMPFAENLRRDVIPLYTIESHGTANTIEDECAWGWPSDDGVATFPGAAAAGLSKGTDFDPSHNQRVYGGQNGKINDFTQGTEKFAYARDGDGEYTGCILEKQPRLGGWSDRSSFPTCGKETPTGDDWPYAYAVAHSIPFDGWIICDTSGSPFHTHNTWPHNHNIRYGLDIHSHHHDDGAGPANNAEFPSPATAAIPGTPHDIYDGYNCSKCALHCSTTCNSEGWSGKNHYVSQKHHHPGPSSRFSWMLGKYDGVTIENFVLILEFYIIKCKKSCECCAETPPNPQKPELIGTATIKTRCGNAKWGDGSIFSLKDPAQKNGNTIYVNAGDAIGIFVKENMAYSGGASTNPTNSTGRLHSPATFSLEVHRKY